MINKDIATAIVEKNERTASLNRASFVPQEYSSLPKVDPDILNQKALALSVLKKVGALDPMAVIAGGAPRNWFYNKPARDLDIYFRSFANTILSRQTQLEAVGLSLSKENVKEREEQGYPSGIMSIQDIECEKINVQLIFLRQDILPGEFVFSKFDCGPSQIYADLYGTVATSGLFEEDHKNNTVTFELSNLDDLQTKRLGLRIAKMERYFPDRKIIIK